MKVRLPPYPVYPERPRLIVEEADRAFDWARPIVTELAEALQSFLTEFGDNASGTTIRKAREVLLKIKTD